MFTLLKKNDSSNTGPRSCHIVLWSWTFQGHYRVDHLGSISVLDTLCFKLSMCQTSLLLTRICPADITIHSRARVLFNVVLKVLQTTVILCKVFEG